MPGLWILRGSNPPLYTKKAADVIIHKATKREYVRGAMKLFTAINAPSTVEDTDEYEFVYLGGNKAHAVLTRDEMVGEIYASTLLNNLRGK